MKNTLKAIGLNNVGKTLILPFATGMALSMCMLTLHKMNQSKKYVLFLRIDQKSCFKSILTSNLVPIII